MEKIRLSGTVPESIVDGPGIRYTIFSQGCNHFCEGCHNPQTHDINGGTELDIDRILEEIKKNPMLKGVTFSGGEPFLQAGKFSEIAKRVHEWGLDVVTYTGYTFESLMEGTALNPDWKALLENTDILIDGPFILEKRNLMLRFRGSENQRILDARQSLINNRAVEKVLV